MTEKLRSEILLEAVNDWLRKKKKGKLSQRHKSLLGHLWIQPNATYQELANKMAEAGKSVGGKHLKNEGSKLFKLISEITETDINKSNIVDELSRWYKSPGRQESEQLYGYKSLFDNLIQLLTTEKYRVICVTGMPMVGKSELIGAVIRHLDIGTSESDRSQYIWLAADKLGTVSKFEQRLCEKLEIKKSNVAQASDSVERVSELLHDDQLVVILENADVLYEPCQPPGTFKEGCGYEELLIQLLTDPTVKGRFVWVSRVLPRCLDRDYRVLYKHVIPPFPVEQAAILLESKWRWSSDERQKLIDFCKGNIGLLLAVAKKINDSYAGRFSQYMAEPFHLSKQCDDIWDAWFEIISGLTKGEKILMVWLLLSPISGEKLVRLYTPSLTIQERRLAIQHLLHRGLIEADEEGVYQLHSPYCRHILGRWLVKYIRENLLDKKGGMLNLFQHPIFLPTAYSYKCEWKRKFLLESIVEEIRAKIWRQQDYAELLGKLNEQSNQEKSIDYSYAVGIILNLAVTRKIPFSTLKVKGLHIRCADLREAIITNTDLTGCIFEESTLPTCFTGTLAADMTSDGSMIVIGDEEGRVGCWIRQGECFVLDKYHRFRSLPKQSVAIQRIIINFDKLIIAAGRSIYRWSMSSDEPPTHLMDVDDEVRSLSQGRDYVAVGLENGHVHLNNLFERREIELPNRHQRPIRLLASDGNDHELATVGYGDRILLWDIQETDNFDTTQKIYARDGIIQAIQWQGNNLLAAATLNGQPSLFSRADRRWQDFPSVQGITCLAFSWNGRFLVGINDHGTLYRWEHGKLEDTERVSLPGLQPRAMVLSDDGKSLLTVCPQHAMRKPQIAQVQLWEVETGYLIWELKTVLPSSLMGVEIRDISGVTAAQRQHLREFSA